MPVTAPALPPKANKHFLGALIELSSEREIELGEDVYSHGGIKLLSRGTRIDEHLYDQVIHHKLKRPIELALVASDEAPAVSFKQEAERLLDERPVLKGFCNWSLGRVTPLGMLERLQFSPQSRTLLAVCGKRQATSQRHCVMVGLIAMGIANAHRYNDSKMLACMLMASLFHDLGEVYLDPELFLPGRRMSPSEWMQYATHPIIGAALAREVVGLDSTIQTAILEHHERLDGFGYPRTLSGQSVSVPGRVLGLAEMLSALVDKDGSLARIDIALKIMPGEIDPAMVSVVAEVVGSVAGVKDAQLLDVEVNVHVAFERIAAVLEAHDQLMSSMNRLSPAVQKTVAEFDERFIRVQRSFASTGAEGFEQLIPLLSPSELSEAKFEVRCVLDEISWRLTKLGRELAYKCQSFSPEEQALLQGLLNALM